MEVALSYGIVKRNISDQDYLTTFPFLCLSGEKAKLRRKLHSVDYRDCRNSASHRVCPFNFMATQFIFQSVGEYGNNLFLVYMFFPKKNKGRKYKPP